MYGQKLVHKLVEKKTGEEKVKINVIEARMENAIEVGTARLRD